MHGAGLGRSGLVWFGLAGLVGWMVGKWDGGDVIVSLIFVILQERRVFIGVPRAWLSCREECGKVKNVRKYACGSGSYFRTFSLIVKYIEIRTRKYHEAS